MDLQKSLQYTDYALNNTLLSQDQLLDKTLRNLEDELIDAAHRHLAGKAGGTKFKFKHGQKLHLEIMNIFETKYNQKMGVLDSGYFQVENLIKKHFKNFDIPVNYSTIDKTMMKALESQDFKHYHSLGVDAQNRIGQAVYDSTLAGRPFTWLQKQIRGSITGHKDVLGRPLSMYAHTYAQDSLMDYYSKIHLMKAGEAGLDKFLYYGNTMNETRPFCISMIGRTLNVKQIKELEGLTWAGKAPGSVMTKRGGYNCRHHWVAVEPDWITEKDQQHFDKEQKRHMGKLDEKEMGKVRDITTKLNKINPAIAKIAVPVSAKTITEEKKFVPANTVEEAKKFAQGNNLAENVDYGKMDLVAINAMNESVFNHVKKYPKLRGNLQFIGSAQARNKMLKKIYYEKAVARYQRLNEMPSGNMTEKNIELFAKREAQRKTRRVPGQVYAQAYRPGGNASGVVINEKFVKNAAVMQKSLLHDVENKWHPENTATIKAVIDHEMGHQMDYLLDIREKQRMTHLYSDAAKQGQEYMQNNLSRYAYRGGKAEFLAEGWAEYINSPNPRTLAFNIGEEMEKLYLIEYGTDAERLAYFIRKGK
jgi:hypothetical protein